MEYNLQDVIFSVSTGLAATLIGSVLYSRYVTRIPSLSGENSPQVSGIWIGSVPCEHKPDMYEIDIIRLSEFQGTVRLYKEHYDNKYSKIAKLKGFGVYKSPYLSAVYFFPESKINYSGTFTLKSSQVPSFSMELRGVYSQIIESDYEDGEYVRPISEKYELKKVKLPISNQLRRLLGMSYFRNYEEIEKFSRNDKKV